MAFPLYRMAMMRGYDEPQQSALRHYADEEMEEII